MKTFGATIPQIFNETLGPTKRWIRRKCKSHCRATLDSSFCFCRKKFCRKCAEFNYAFFELKNFLQCTQESSLKLFFQEYLFRSFLISEVGGNFGDLREQDKLMFCKLISWQFIFIESYQLRIIALWKPILGKHST